MNEYRGTPRSRLFRRTSLDVTAALRPDDVLRDRAATFDDLRGGDPQEAFELLDLINAEFQSDPMSTQCFDRRIVDRVKAWVEKNREGRR